MLYIVRYCSNTKNAFAQATKICRRTKFIAVDYEPGNLPTIYLVNQMRHTVFQLHQPCSVRIVLPGTMPDSYIAFNTAADASAALAVIHERQHTFCDRSEVAAFLKDELLMVGDSGIYMMSDGHPGLEIDECRPISALFVARYEQFD